MSGPPSTTEQSAAATAIEQLHRVGSHFSLHPFGLLPPQFGHFAPEQLKMSHMSHPGLPAAFPDPYFGFGGAAASALDLNGVRRKNATRETTAALKAWLYEHRTNPYPTKGEKIMLAILTKMTLTQVSTWFANARRRLKKENKMTWEPRNRPGDDDDDLGAPLNDSDRPLSGMSELSNEAGNNSSVSSGGNASGAMPTLPASMQEQYTQMLQMQQAMQKQIQQQFKTQQVQNNETKKRPNEGTPDESPVTKKPKGIWSIADVTAEPSTSDTKDKDAKSDRSVTPTTPPEKKTAPQVGASPFMNPFMQHQMAAFMAARSIQQQSATYAPFMPPFIRPPTSTSMPQQNAVIFQALQAQMMQHQLAAAVATTNSSHKGSTDDTPTTPSNASKSTTPPAKSS